MSLEAVFPGPDHGQGFSTSLDSGLPFLGSRHHGGLPGPEKWINQDFLTQKAWNRDQPRISLVFNLTAAAQKMFIFRLHRERELTVGPGIFMGAEHPGFRRQGCQLVQGQLHLLRAALEQAAAAYAEQSVTAEQATVAEKSDMAAGVARYFQYTEFEIERWQTDRLILRKHAILAFNAWIMRPEYFRSGLLLQASHAPDMVGVVVCNQDITQLQAFLLQQIQHGLRISGVHHGTGSSTAGDQPDIIV